MMEHDLIHALERAVDMAVFGKESRRGSHFEVSPDGELYASILFFEDIDKDTTAPVCRIFKIGIVSEIVDGKEVKPQKPSKETEKEGFADIPF